MTISNISSAIFHAVGKRKCAIAHLVVEKGTGEIIINGIPANSYFQGNSDLLSKLNSPLQITQVNDSYNLIIKVTGGGLKGQAESIRLAIARALSTLNSENKAILKKSGLLTRDSRIKERKKYGLKKARKASQFSKR